MNEKFNCIIDARVSTDKQLGGSSLDNQEFMCRGVAQREGWDVKEVFAKSYSGRAEERGDFNEIINYIKESNSRGVKIHYYLIKSIDRFTRGGAAIYSEMKSALSDLGVSLVDAYRIIQESKNTLDHLGVEYDWSRYDPSETAELFEASRGKADHRDTVTRLITAEIIQTREGYSMRKPNDGYLNTKRIVNSKPHSVLAQDPGRAHYYSKMFEMRALGCHTDQEIVNTLNSMGYRSVAQNRWLSNGKDKTIVGQTKPKKLTVKKLQAVIKRTLYAGVKYEKWNQQPVAAVFGESENSITSIDTFNKANRGKIEISIIGDKIKISKNLNNRSTVKRLKYHPDYKFDKMIHCQVCNKPLKNSGKGNKGKSGEYFQAHHCDRSIECKKITGRIPKAEFEQSVAELLNNLKFSDGFARKLKDKLISKYKKREKEVLDQAITVGVSVNDLKQKQSSLMTKIEVVSSAIVIRNLEQEIESLEAEILEATEARDKIEIKERDVKAFVRYAEDLMEHPMKILGNNRNPYEQRAFFDLLFETPPTYTQIVSGTPNLRLLFKLSEEYKTNKSSLVTH
jgi:hypothetical protein